MNAFTILGLIGFGILDLWGIIYAYINWGLIGVIAAIFLPPVTCLFIPLYALSTGLYWPLILLVVSAVLFYAPMFWDREK